MSDNIKTRIKQLETALGKEHHMTIADFADVTIAGVRYTAAALMAMYTACEFPPGWNTPICEEAKKYCMLIRRFLDGESGDTFFYLTWGAPPTFAYHIPDDVKRIQLNFPDAQPEL